MQHIWGAELRALRHGRGMSLEDVGRAAGISYPTVSRIERGCIRGRPETIHAILAALGAADRISEFDAHLTRPRREIRFTLDPETPTAFARMLLDLRDAYLRGTLTLETSDHIRSVLGQRPPS